MMKTLNTGRLLGMAAAAGVAAFLIAACWEDRSGDGQMTVWTGADLTNPAAVSEETGLSGHAVPDGRDEAKLAEEHRRALWMLLVPAIQEASVQRRAIAESCQQDVDDAIRRAMENVGASAFADAVCGWESTWQRLQGDDVHSRWLMDQFEALVFDDKELTALLLEQMQQVHQRLTQVDDDLLVRLQADVALAPGSLLIAPVDLSGMDSAFRPLVLNSGTYLRQAWGESVLGMMAGTAAAGAVATGVKALGYLDDSSQSTPIMALVGTATTVAAEFAAAEIVEYAISSRGELARFVEERVRSELDKCRPGHEGAEIWTRPLWDLVRNHDQALTSSLIEAVQVDANWAMESLSAFELPVDGASPATGSGQASSAEAETTSEQTLTEVPQN